MLQKRQKFYNFRLSKKRRYSPIAVRRFLISGIKKNSKKVKNKFRIKTDFDWRRTIMPYAAAGLLTSIIAVGKIPEKTIKDFAQSPSSQIVLTNTNKISDASLPTLGITPTSTVENPDVEKIIEDKLQDLKKKGLLTGPQGPKGNTGKDGSVGPQGVTGAPGTNQGTTVFTTQQTIINTLSDLPDDLTLSNLTVDNLTVDNLGNLGIVKSQNGLLVNDLVDLSDPVNNVTGTLGTASGGTGVSNFLQNGLLVGNGSGALQTISAPAAGNILIGNNSGTPAFQTLSGDAVLDPTGVLNLATTGVSSGNYGLVNSIPFLTIDSKGRVTQASNTAIAINANQITSGTLTALQGGTGLSSLGSANQILGVNNAGTGYESKSVNSSTNINVSNGVGSISIATSLTPSFTTVNGLSLTSAADGLTVSGGTTSRTLTISGANVSLNQSLTTASTPSFNSLILSNALGVSNGGTGSSNFTTNGLLIGNGNNAVQVTSAPSSGQLLIGNGSSVPTFTTLSGDIGSINGNGAVTLANTAVSSGSYGLASSVPSLTIDSKGRITGASNTAIAIDANQIISGTLTAVQGGTGLSSLGGTNQILGVNNTGTAYESKTVNSSTNINVSNSAGSISIATSLTPSFTTVNNLSLTAAADGLTLSGGTTSRTLTVSGANVSLNQSLRSSDTPTFGGLTTNGNVLANNTVVATGTLANGAGSCVANVNGLLTAVFVSNASINTSMIFYDVTLGKHVAISSVNTCVNSGTTYTILGILTITTAAGHNYTVYNPVANIGDSAGGFYNNFFALTLKGVTSSLSGGFDVAEQYQTHDSSLVGGDLVAIDTDDDEEIAVKKTSEAYDLNMIGVVSSQPALTLGDEIVGDWKPIALVGRVPVKVNLENGPIRKGDLLTSSSIPGVAMRATKKNSVIGQALENFNSLVPGKILMFIKPHSEPVLESAPENSLDLTSLISKMDQGVQFNTDVKFLGVPYFNQNTVGILTVPAGQKVATYNFSKSFPNKPAVNVTLNSQEDPIIEQQILDNQLVFVVSVSESGFTIKLNQIFDTDLQFSWTAFAAAALNPPTTKSIDSKSNLQTDPLPADNEVIPETKPEDPTIDKAPVEENEVEQNQTTQPL